MTAVPRLFTLLDGLSRRSPRLIDDIEWHDSPAVYQSGSRADETSWET
ncbi:hypothetical protein [Streptomyces roseoviridis]|uniref:Transposase n=1 Tax=Streptomyces roseoviridis TaxID=67361 RepID=A0ABV5QUW0_9ACTN